MQTSTMMASNQRIRQVRKRQARSRGHQYRVRGTVVRKVCQIGVALLLAAVLAGCASGPDAIVIPINKSAAPRDIESLQDTLCSDSRVEGCVYTWANGTASGSESWLEVTLPAGQSQTEFEGLLADIESIGVLEEVVDSSGEKWWSER